MSDLPNVPELEIRRFRGDSAALTCPLYDPDTGAADYAPTGPLLFTLKESSADPDTSALIQKLSNAGGLTLANPTVVSLVADDATLISPQKTYLFDILDTATNRTVAQGTFWTEQRLSLTGALAIATTVIDPASPYLSAAQIETNRAAAEAAAAAADAKRQLAEAAAALAQEYRDAAAASAGDASAAQIAAGAAQVAAELARDAAQAAQAAAEAAAALALEYRDAAGVSASAASASASAAAASQSAASASESAAAPARIPADAAAATATTEAGIATTQAGIATAQAVLAQAAAGTAWKGLVAGASVPLTSTAAGDRYIIFPAGTSQGKTWAAGDMAVYLGTSGSWMQIPAAIIVGMPLPMASARAVGSFIESDGATSNRAVVHPLPFSLAGQACVFRVKFVVPTSNPSANGYAWALSNSGSSTPGLANYGLHLRFTLAGELMLSQEGATAETDYRQGLFSTFRSTYSGQMVDIIIRFPAGDSTTNPTIRCNGVDITSSFTFSTAGTAPNWLPASLASSYYLSGFNFVAGKFWLYPPVLGTMTDAECDAATTTGLWPDWWYAGTGSPVTKFTGIEQKTAGGLTSTGDATSGAGWTITGMKSGSSFFKPLPTFSVVAGWRYRVSADVTLNSGSALLFYASPAGQFTLTTQSLNQEFVANVTTTVTVYTLAADGSSIDTKIANLRFYELGPIFEPVVQPCLVVDDIRSNGITGYLTSGMSPVVPHTGGTRRAFIRAKTLTFTTSPSVLNLQIAGASVIDASSKYRIVSVSGTASGSANISLGSASGGAQYVSAKAVTAADFDVTDAQFVTRRMSGVNLWIKSDAAVVISDVLIVLEKIN